MSSDIAFSIMFGSTDNVIELIWNAFETTLSAAGSISDLSI